MFYRIFLFWTLLDAIISMTLLVIITLKFPGASGLEACEITCSLLNRRSLFSFVGTLRRQIALPAEGPNPLFRPLSAPWIDCSRFFDQKNSIDFGIVFWMPFWWIVLWLKLNFCFIFMIYEDNRNLIFCSKSNEITSCCISFYDFSCFSRRHC